MIFLYLSTTAKVKIVWDKFQVLQYGGNSKIPLIFCIFLGLKPLPKLSNRETLGLWNQENWFHIKLWVTSHFWFNLLLTVGLTFDTSHTICVFFATCLHYFYLVVAFWMNVLHFDLCRVCFKRCLLHKGQFWSILFSAFLNLNFWRFCFDFKNAGRRNRNMSAFVSISKQNKNKQKFDIRKF